MDFIAFFNASLFSLETEKMTLPDLEKAFVISDAIALEVREEEFTISIVSEPLNIALPESISMKHPSFSTRVFAATIASSSIPF